MKKIIIRLICLAITLYNSIIPSTIYAQNSTSTTANNDEPDSATIQIQDTVFKWMKGQPPVKFDTANKVLKNGQYDKMYLYSLACAQLEPATLNDNKVDSAAIQYKDTVIKWLKGQLSTATPVKNDIVHKILQNAEYNKMYFITRQGNHTGLIVPIKRSYFSQHISHSEPLPFSNLVFYFNEQGRLRDWADVMLIYPVDKSLKELPRKTIPNFTSDHSTLDGTYTWISVYIGDRKLSEMDIKGGKRIAYRSWYSKKNEGDMSDKQEWFLKTDTIEESFITKTITKSLGKSSTVNPPKFKGDKRIEGINQ